MALFIAIFFTSTVLLPQASWGRVILDDISSPSQEVFSLQEFCKKMVTHPSPLVEIRSAAIVDCMGKKVKVSDFCQKQMVTDPYYLRGYAKNNRIECISGKKVIFKYACRHNDKLCGSDAKSTCEKLKSQIAFRLDLIHASLLIKEKNKQLNCFYESLPLKNEKNN